jgi:hypothetical protein
MPTQHANADVMIGQREARKKNQIPEQSDEMRMACVSYYGRERLAASLVAIIYLH